MYPTFKSFRLQPPDGPRHRFDTLPFSVPGFSALAWRSLGFTIRSRARRTILPNRVRFRFGPILHIQLLSTWPHGHAVTFSYGPENACPERTCTSLIWYTLRRTNADVLVGTEEPAFQHDNPGPYIFPSSAITALIRCLVIAMDSLRVRPMSRRNSFHA